MAIISPVGSGAKPQQPPIVEHIKPVYVKGKKMDEGPSQNSKLFLSELDSINRRWLTDLPKTISVH